MSLPASDERIWRYLSFPKFVSLLEMRALWMCRLGKLQDQFEGTLPEKTRNALVVEDLRWKESFAPELHDQLASMTDDNVKSGRDMLVVNCWFLGGGESTRMWGEYASLSEGVAVRSTLSRLEGAIVAKQKFTRIGRVKYVDFATHDMGRYAGNQAGERALLKQLAYAHESEVRITTLNLVCPGTLNADGSPPTPLQLSGPGMFDADRAGLYLRVDLNVLAESIVTAPQATPWFQDLVSRLCARYGMKCVVERSAIERP